jgi:hypothetical protein
MSNNKEQYGPYINLLIKTPNFWTRLGLSMIANCPEAIPQLAILLNNNSTVEKKINEKLVSKTKRIVS